MPRPQLSIAGLLVHEPLHGVGEAGDVTARLLLESDAEIDCDIQVTYLKLDAGLKEPTPGTTVVITPQTRQYLGIQRDMGTCICTTDGLQQWSGVLEATIYDPLTSVPAATEQRPLDQLKEKSRGPDGIPVRYEIQGRIHREFTQPGDLRHVVQCGFLFVKLEIEAKEIDLRSLVDSVEQGDPTVLPVQARRR
ncbi:hypothetical protein OHC33_011250 [Knufia fluminis]|uniref:Uncharacterized protein n=1 Tax=Knufia fluminis TaxID=191047 RepID=A0AAN8I211_9EURO|nr:hypothetical protein OHC33_011250 [Knufia fluminis]